MTGKIVLAALAWCVLLIAPSAAAQDVRNPQSSVGNQERNSLRVDPITHALQFQIPLGQYAGRAGMGMPITLNYSSKLWNIKHMSTIQCQDTPGSLYRAEYAKGSASGWTSSLDWFTWDPDITLETYDGYTTKPANSRSLLHKIARMHVTLPDGSRHELRKDDDFHPHDETITGLFYSVDGSRLVYDKSTSTLYLPDGSRYAGASNTYVDRNGNRHTYNPETRQWTDTLGRTFGLPLPAAGVGDATGAVEQDTTYSLPGVNDTSITYTLRWRRLSTVGVISEHEADQTLRHKGDRTTNCQWNTDRPGLFRSTDSDLNGMYKQAVSVFDPVVLHQIVLPTGQSYTFKYNIYGEITKVIHPTGGYERFSYGPAPKLSAEDGVGIYAQANRGVLHSWVSPDGTTGGEGQTPLWSYEGFSTVARDGTRTDRSVFTNPYDWSAYGFEDPRLGMAYDERTLAPSGQMLRRRLIDYAVDGQVVAHGGYYAHKQRNPRPAKVVEILLDTAGDALYKMTRYEYDGDLNVTRVKHYEFVVVDQHTAQTAPVTSFAPPESALVRIDEADYLTGDQAYRDRNLLSLPVATRVRDGAGTIVAQAEARYDEGAYPMFPCGAAVGWTDPGTGARGLPTTARIWLSTSNTWLETHARYDGCGNARMAWDAKGNLSEVEYSASYHHAFPTKNTSPAPGASGSTTPFETTATYDLTTGLVTQTTDANDKVTSYQYNDPLNRLKRVERPDGGRTTYTYVDQHQCGPYVRARTLLNDSGLETDDYQFFDGLGRGVRSFKYDPQNASNPYLTADTQYDALGRVRRVSNPYRSAGCTSAVNPSERWTTTAYDALGRVTTVTTPDGAAVTTAYSGNAVTVSDQAGKSRRSVSDALGRLTQVIEAPGAGTCQSAGAGCATTYAYDAFGKLRKVTQGAQLRYFMYDSLGRLIRAKNPEQAVNAELALTDTYKAPDDATPNGQWTLAYSYDANGNVLTRTDARNVRTTYTYDNLNRSSTVDYSDTNAINPDVRRYYDNPAAGANGRGRFWYDFAGDSPSSQTGEHTAVDSYDALGRPLVRRQQFKAGGAWSGHYQTSRQYNRAGGVVSQTYPSGHAVSYSYDAAGRLADYNGQVAFSGNLGDGVQRAYASQVAYDEAGRMSEERFGARTPLYHKRAFNVRGQLYDVRLSTYSQAAAPWNWNRGALLNYYSQNDINAPTNEARANSGPENNGNLKLAQHFVPTDDQISGASWMSQAYDYDSLNRISYVKEQHNGGTYTGEQHYTYDRWGSRTINTTETYGTGIPEPQFELSPPQNTQEVAEPSNRLYAPGDAGRIPTQKLMRYDKAGNLVHDDSYPGGGGRSYDAENRITEAWGYSAIVNGPFQSKYAYDAGGRRVRRKTAAGEVWQVYGLSGELLAEYQAGAATILATKEYGYRGGELLVTAASGDDGRLLRFLHKLYNALGRGPNAAEQQAGMAALSAAAAQGQPQLLQAGRDLAAALFNSAEYAARGRTDSQFVTDLYWAYPQRQPDPGGHQVWLNAIPTHGRAAVRDGFAYSPEFDSLAGRVYGLSPSEDQRTELFMYKLYTSLARDPSAAELSARVGRVNTAAAQGRTETVAEARAIGRELFLSQEYANRNRSNREFVYDLYVALLDREPDAGGWDAWTNAAAASGRTAVLDGLVNSGEFENRASTLYREVFWLVADHLGTPRMLADRSGNLAGVRRHDYLPFGEEVGEGVGGRTKQQGYNQVDGVRQKFTGSERDGETGLDFMRARHYTSTQGRFISVDPLLASAAVTSPQTWNRYSYTLNNPLRYVDPTGLRTQNPPDRRNLPSLNGGPGGCVGADCSPNNPVTEDVMVTAPADEITTTSTTVGTTLNLQGPTPTPGDPNELPVGDSLPERYGTNPIETTIEGIALLSSNISNMAVTAVNESIPDFWYFQADLPVIGGGNISVSRDAQIYGGFNILGALSGGTINRSNANKFRGGWQTGLGKFLRTGMSPEDRHNAMAGTDFNVSAGLVSGVFPMDKGDPVAITVGGPLSFGPTVSTSHHLYDIRDLFR